MKLIVYYDKDDHPIAEGTSAHDLARKLGITPQAVSHYYCKLTGEANFLTHECDVSAFEMMGEE